MSTRERGPVLDEPEVPVGREDGAAPVGRLLRAGALPGACSLAVSTLAVTLTGRERALSLLAGGLVALAALAVPALVNVLCLRLQPTTTVAVVMSAYSCVVVLVGMAYSVLDERAWLTGPWAAVGVLVAAVSWVVGHMRASLHLRQLLYEVPASTPR